MCFWKSKKSKVLRAKRDIVVYKIGNEANKNVSVEAREMVEQYKVL